MLGCSLVRQQRCWARLMRYCCQPDQILLRSRYTLNSSGPAIIHTALCVICHTASSKCRLQHMALDSVMLCHDGRSLYRVSSRACTRSSTREYSENCSMLTHQRFDRVKRACMRPCWFVEPALSRKLHCERGLASCTGALLRRYVTF
jgi:hypothetical protein